MGNLLGHSHTASLECCRCSTGAEGSSAEHLSPRVKTWQLLQITRSVIATQSKKSLDKWEDRCLGISDDCVLLSHLLLFNPSQKHISGSRLSSEIMCLFLPRSGSGRCVRASVGYISQRYMPYVCLRRCSSGGQREGMTGSFTCNPPCDVPVIDTEHSTGLLWDP